MRREAEQISLLEGKLQQAVNENAELKIKKIENSKFWERLDSKISLTNTLCDQLTLHQIASQSGKGNIYGDSYLCTPCYSDLTSKKRNNNLAPVTHAYLGGIPQCVLHDLSTKL